MLKKNLGTHILYSDNLLKHTLELFREPTYNPIPYIELSTLLLKKIITVC